MRFSAKRALFSAEQAHVYSSYKTAADWLELARVRQITGFLIGYFLMTVCFTRFTNDQRRDIDVFYYTDGSLRR